MKGLNKGMFAKIKGELRQIKINSMPNLNEMFDFYK